MRRTLEYATTKEECTLESKSCLESVAAPTAAHHKWLNILHTCMSWHNKLRNLSRVEVETRRYGERYQEKKIKVVRPRISHGKR